MVWSKVVTPVKAGVQYFCNTLKFLDSGVHRNDVVGGELWGLALTHYLPAFSGSFTFKILV
jgi:hypothetical protein